MHPQLIVSFTSYPARIHAVHQVLKSLYAQSLQPDRILLWLAEEQFPNREADLPEELMADAEIGKFELRWCDDLGSHKKYFYAMQEYPDDIIVTVDDDTIYHPETIKTLYESYLNYPQAVSALRTTLMLFWGTGGLMPESFWIYRYTDIVATPCMQLVAIGLGGVLYPPHLLDSRVFDKEMMLKLCTSDGITSGDDLWLKMHEVLLGTPVVLASGDIEHEEIADTQKSALWIVKPITFKTELIKAIRKYYEIDGEDILSRCLRLTTGGTISQTSNMETWDDVNLLNSIKYQLNLSNRSIASSNMDVANRIIDYVKDLFRLSPKIQSWAERSREVEVRSVCDYGLGLRARLWGEFRQPADYLQMQSSWKAFLAEHPNCDNLYIKGYRSFLNDMAGFVYEMEQDGCPDDRVAECRKAIRSGWRTLPLRVRVKDLEIRLLRHISAIYRRK